MHGMKRSPQLYLEHGGHHLSQHSEISLLIQASWPIDHELENQAPHDELGGGLACQDRGPQDRPGPKRKKKEKSAKIIAFFFIFKQNVPF